MKVSFFETGRYPVNSDTPREWPVPSAAYDPEAGAKAYRAMVERARFVQKLGFDWISLSEHHYSPRILTPSPPLSAAHLASQVDGIKIALLGPIVPASNPIRPIQRRSRVWIRIDVLPERRRPFVRKSLTVASS